MAAKERPRAGKTPRRVRQVMANGDILCNDEIAHYVIDPDSFPPAAARIVRELVKETSAEREARLPQGGSKKWTSSK